MLDRYAGIYIYMVSAATYVGAVSRLRLCSKSPALPSSQMSSPGE